MRKVKFLLFSSDWIRIHVSANDRMHDAPVLLIVRRCNNQLSDLDGRAPQHSKR